jgi:spore maturation protein CgeB
VYYSFDDPDLLDSNPIQPKEFEYAVTCCEGSLPWYEKHGVKAITLYPPADLDLHGKAKPNPEHESDICFIGTNTYPKERFPRVLASRRDMILGVETLGQIALYGHWNRGRFGWGSPVYSLPACMEELYRGWVDYNDHPGIYAAAKINLGSHIRPDGYKYLNQRVIDTMASGGFLLCDAVNGIDEVFDVGAHLDTWSCLEELHWKTEFWLQHDDKRKVIAQQGREFVLDHFNNRKFAESIIELCK